MYEARGWFKTAEEDNFEHGCLMEGGHSDYSATPLWQAETVDDLVRRIALDMGWSFVGPDGIDPELDACDEAGRIDVQVMETDDGYAPTPEELDLWKKGKCRLWLCNYIFHVEHVVREVRTLRVNA